jgi:arylsulfatase A-like enzyme
LHICEFSSKEGTVSLPEHPNLLVLITDQERAIQHFPRGWKAANLPNFTRLERNGLAFDRAYTCACMCSPSRSAIFTGHYPAQTGVTDTLSFGSRWAPSRYSDAETVLDPSTPNLATALWNGAGYEVHYRGKWHLSKGSGDTENGLLGEDLAIYGFRGWLPPDAGEDTKIENLGGGFANHDARYAEQAAEFLRGAAELDRPFCLVASLVNPHDVLTYPNTYQAGGYTAADLEGDIGLPPTYQEDLRSNGKPTAQWLMLKLMAAGLGALPSDDDKLAYLNFYGNLMRRVDAELGRVLDALDDAGLTDSTIVVRLSDHGEMGMAHGGLRQKAFNVYEESIHVPLVISNPVLFPEPSRTAHLASTIDLLPTLCGLAGVPAPRRLPGRDLAPLIEKPDCAEPPRQHVLFTFDDVRASSTTQKEAVPAANRIRCLRQKHWKFARYFHADSSFPEQEEMYFLGPEADLGADPDPHEMQNLAWPGHPLYDAPEIRAKRDELRDELARLVRREVSAVPEEEGGIGQ